MIKIKSGAVMMNFLVGMLVAVILFSPVIYVGNKMIGGSNQAEDSFFKLADFIEEFSQKGTEGEKRVFLLIEDENMAIYFNRQKGENNYKKYYLDTRKKTPDDDFGINIEFGDVYSGEVEPSYFTNFSLERCDNKDCICYCTEYLKETSKDLLLLSTVTEKYSCKKLVCRKFEKEISGNKWFYYRNKEDTKRRIKLDLLKFKDKIYISSGDTELITPQEFVLKNFVKVIEDLSKNGVIGATKEINLNQVEKSVIAAFNDKTSVAHFFYDVKFRELKERQYINWIYPQEKCQGKPCICLCENYLTDQYKNGDALACQELSCKTVSTTFSYTWTSVFVKGGKVSPTKVTFRKIPGSIVIQGGNVENTILN